MSTYQYVNLSVCQVAQQLRSLLPALRTCQIVNPDRQVLQSFGEGLVVLVGKHRRRHKHSHLLRVAGSLEGGTHCHFRLSEAYIATHEPVHRFLAFHVGLHLVGGAKLVGSVLVKEARLQFVLQERVVAEGKALLVLATRIELYEVAGNVLDLLLGAFFQFLPLPGAESAHTRRLTVVLRLVFRHLI